MLPTMLEKWRHRSLGPRSYLRAAEARVATIWVDAGRTGASLLAGSSTGVTKPYVPPAAEIERIRTLLTRILTENIVPFWYPRVLDTAYGGYALSFDRYGRNKGPARKGIVSQARTLWYFSRLARLPHEQRDHLAAAAHGFRFLRDRLWDPAYGGFHWEVDALGAAVTAPHKHVFGQVAALYGITEYARASSDDEAIGLARALFDLLELKAHDEQYGGYREFFTREWMPAPEGIPNYLATDLPADAKTANTHMHLMESIANYRLLTGDERAGERLRELLTINNSTVVRHALGATSPAYRYDWTPVRGGMRDEVLYGYQLKNIWLSMETRREIGAPIAPLLDLYRTLFRYASRNGFDRTHGGYFESGRLGWPAMRRNKVWWVQAEGLLCALYLYAYTREEEYFEYFRRTVDWIDAWQVDWQYGEWFARAEYGKGWGDKADQWKDPYHNGRAMIVGLDVLAGLAAPQDRASELMAAARG